MHCSNGSNGSRALSAVWMALSRACLWSPALAPRCQHARPHRTAVKHTVGGQRLGRLALACFATEKKSWKPLFTGIAYAISSSSVGAETGGRGPFQNTCQARAPVILLPAFIRRPSTHHHRTRNRRENVGGPLVGGVGCAGLIDAWIAC